MKLLLGLISELREFVSFSGDLDYQTLKPAIRAAQDLLSRYVGAQLLEELGADALNEEQTELLPYVQAPIAALALLKFANAGNVRIGDLGVMRTKTADSSDAFEWQLERVVQELKLLASDGIESLLRYLEGKLSVFTTYKDSDEYKAEKGKLIQSAVIFSRYYEINSSRLILQTLQACLRTSELTIRKVLGSDTFTLLLGADLSEPQEETLDAARRALVYLTIARALREKLVSISDTGVQVNGVSNFGTLNYKQPASDKQLATALAYWDQQASTFLSDLITLVTPAPITTTPVTGSPIINKAIVSI